MACPRIIENFLSALTFLKLCRMPFYFFNFFIFLFFPLFFFFFFFHFLYVPSLRRSSSICLLFPFLFPAPPFRSCSPLFLFLLLFSVHPSIFHVSSHFFLSLFLVLLLPLAVFGPSPSICASPLLPCCPLSNRLASSVRGNLLPTVRLHLGHARFLGHVLVVRLGNAS